MLIKDEIRKEAIDGIKLVQSAGIKTVMITGDNKNTAISIGKETGILKEDGIVLTSDEMNNMSDEKLKEKSNIILRFTGVISAGVIN